MLESACCGCKYYSKCGKPDRERKCLGYESFSHREKKMRLICFCDGTGIGDYLYVVNTNAPMTELKELERKSCQVYLNGGSYEDVPIWAESLEKKDMNLILLMNILMFLLIKHRENG